MGNRMRTQSLWKTIWTGLPIRWNAIDHTGMEAKVTHPRGHRTRRTRSKVRMEIEHHTIVGNRVPTTVLALACLVWNRKVTDYFRPVWNILAYPGKFWWHELLKSQFRCSSHMFAWCNQCETGYSRRFQTRESFKTLHQHGLNEYRLHHLVWLNDKWRWPQLLINIIKMSASNVISPLERDNQFFFEGFLPYTTWLILHHVSSWWEVDVRQDVILTIPCEHGRC